MRYSRISQPSFGIAQDRFQAALTYTAQVPISPDRILYKDDHLLAVNKRGGELVVRAGEGGELPLYDFLHKDYPGLRVLHRLDFGTSGVVLFARTAEAAKHVRDSKFEGWKKTYRALVCGKIAARSGVIRTPLQARTFKGLVNAQTRYRVLETFPFATLVEAQIDTGRRHQIRQHFAAIGHPLLLDPQYGDPRKDRAFKKHFKYRKLFLHAASLVLPHPVTGKEVIIEAPMPGPFLKVIQQLATRNP